MMSLVQNVTALPLQIVFSSALERRNNNQLKFVFGCGFSLAEVDYNQISKFLALCTDTRDYELLRLGLVGQPKHFVDRFFEQCLLLPDLEAVKVCVASQPLLLSTEELRCIVDATLVLAQCCPLHQKMQAICRVSSVGSDYSP